MLIAGSRESNRCLWKKLAQGLRYMQALAGQEPSLAQQHRHHAPAAQFAKAAPGASYKATVVGAGPAGLALVATLLDTGATPILWVDPAFNAGRLSRYPEVPSNTRVNLFQRFALVSPTLSSVGEAALAPFKALDPESTCPLSHAIHMVKELTHTIAMNHQDKVHCRVGTVSELSRHNGVWTVDGEHTSERVYLATGGRPLGPTQAVAPPAWAQVLALDDLVLPSRLPTQVSPADTVAVVGGSHSAMLILRNLLEMSNGPREVINLYRSPLRYAVYMPDDWILYDSTGLKGEVAEWAKAKLDSKEYEKTGRLQRFCINDYDDPRQLLQPCNKVVYAMGFEQNPLPSITIDGQRLNQRPMPYNPNTGQIAEQLFGFGIAFPERWVDRHGNVEHAVGMWKFMRYVRSNLQQASSEMQQASGKMQQASSSLIAAHA